MKSFVFSYYSKIQIRKIHFFCIVFIVLIFSSLTQCLVYHSIAPEQKKNSVSIGDRKIQINSNEKQKIEEPEESEETQEELLFDEIAGLTAGSFHACSWSKNGVALCWGKQNDNKLEKLGNSNRETSYEPVYVQRKIGETLIQLQNIIHVAAGKEHSCAVVRYSQESNFGRVYCWGDNSSGQIALGKEISSSAYAQKVEGLYNIKKVYAGAFHTCALDIIGGVICWGLNNYGQLGNGKMGRELDEDEWERRHNCFGDQGLLYEVQKHRAWDQNTRERIQEDTSLKSSLIFKNIPDSNNPILKKVAIQSDSRLINSLFPEYIDLYAYRHGNSYFYKANGNLQINIAVENPLEFDRNRRNFVSLNPYFSTRKKNSIRYLLAPEDRTRIKQGEEHFPYIKINTEDKSYSLVYIKTETRENNADLKQNTIALNVSNSNSLEVELASERDRLIYYPTLLESQTNKLKRGERGGFDKITRTAQYIFNDDIHLYSYLQNCRDIPNRTFFNAQKEERDIFYQERFDDNKYNVYDPLDQSNNSNYYTISQNAVSLSLGASHSCALLRNQQVKCWGNNAWGQLGDGTFIHRAKPISIKTKINAEDPPSSIAISKIKFHSPIDGRAVPSFDQNLRAIFQADLINILHKSIESQVYEVENNRELILPFSIKTDLLYEQEHQNKEGMYLYARKNVNNSFVPRRNVLFHFPIFGGIYDLHRDFNVNEDDCLHASILDEAHEPNEIELENLALLNEDCDLDMVYPSIEKSDPTGMIDSFYEITPSVSFPKRLILLSKNADGSLKKNERQQLIAEEKAHELYNTYASLEKGLLQKSKITSVMLGQYHSCLKLKDGKRLCWGAPKVSESVDLFSSTTTEEKVIYDLDLNYENKEQEEICTEWKYEKQLVDCRIKKKFSLAFLCGHYSAYWNYSRPFLKTCKDPKEMITNTSYGNRNASKSTVDGKCKKKCKAVETQFSFCYEQRCRNKVPVRFKAKSNIEIGPPVAYKEAQLFSSLPIFTSRETDEEELNLENSNLALENRVFVIKLALGLGKHQCAILRYYTKNINDKIYCWGKDNENTRILDGKTGAKSISVSEGFYNSHSLEAKGTSLKNFQRIKQIVLGEDFSCVWMETRDDTGAKIAKDSIHCWGGDPNKGHKAWGHNALGCLANSAQGYTLSDALNITCQVPLFSF